MGEAVGARGASGGGPLGCALLDTGFSGVGAFASYGDSMILAERIFSQSAPGYASSAYFRKLAHSAG